MSVCPEFKEIQVYIMDFQSLFLHTKWPHLTSGKPVTKVCTLLYSEVL